MHALPIFEVTTSVDADDCLRLKVTGEIDLWSAREAEQRLAAERDARACVYIDLSDVTFMGAAAARFLVGARLKTRISGQRLVVVGGPTAHPVLNATGLLDMLDVVD
jgi:anti-anti-sigma factor